MTFAGQCVRLGDAWEYTWSRTDIAPSAGEVEELRNRLRQRSEAATDVRLLEESIERAERDQFIALAAEATAQERTQTTVERFTGYIPYVLAGTGVLIGLAIFYGIGKSKKRRKR